MRSRTQPEPVNAYLPSRVGINGVEDHDKRYDELPQNYLNYLILEKLRLTRHCRFLPKTTQLSIQKSIKRRVIWVKYNSE